jgi:hypothetical protein
MRHGLSLLIALLACQPASAAAIAGERSTGPAALSGQKDPGRKAIKDARMVQASSLDRVVIAVDSAESSHGKDPAMWRPDPSGPQGPMQVSEAAATDVGGGDRFDVGQNRAIGRAYLAQLYGRYGNWHDAVAAYNWGMGKMDAWLRAGRPPDKFHAGVAVYTRRVLNESGLCTETQTGGTLASASSAHWWSPVPEHLKEDAQSGQPVAISPDALISSACAASDTWRGAYSFPIGPSRFVKKLDHAMRLAVMRPTRGY